MKRLLATARGIDRLSDAVGRLCSWLVLAMVAAGAYNAIARYLGRRVGVNLSSNAYIELQWYLFSLVFLLGAAWALRCGAHVRVDVLYGRLSPRGKAWIDLLGTLLLQIPFCVTALVLCWPSVRNSWAVLESSPDPGGLPRWPLKAVIPLAFVLLILQGIAQAVHCAARLAGREDTR